MKGHVTEKELKYFSYKFKKSCNLGMLYLSPKILSKTFLADGARIFWSPSETMMQSGNTYIKGSGHFLEKINTLGCIPDNAILVTADAVGL